MVSLNNKETSYFNPQSKVNQIEKNEIPAHNDPENLPDLKFFDLYQHMKINVNHFERNCKDDVDNITNFCYYCVPCKISVCHLCNYQLHKSHFLIKQINFEMEKKTITNVFNTIEDDIKSNPIFQNTDKLRESIAQNIVSQFDVLYAKLGEIKEIKLRELDVMFKKNEGCLGNLKKNIDDTKKTLTTFFEKNKTFVNSDKYENDEENALFLINFEMLNMCIQKNKEMKVTMVKIGEEFKNYQNISEQKTELILKSLEEFKVDMSKEDVSNPKFTIPLNFDKLSVNFYKDVQLRLVKYNEHFDNFKTMTFDTLKKNGGYKEIEKIINLFDKKNEKGIAFIFSHENPNKASKEKAKIVAKKDKNSTPKSSSPKNSKFNNQEISKEDNIENDLIDIDKNKSDERLGNGNQTDLLLQEKILNMKTKYDIVLDHQIIQRYFSYATMDVVNKNFRVKTYSGATSSGNLFIKPDFEQDEDADKAKPIIGTNEIHIYDRKKRILLKKKVNLDKMLHGFTIFLDGMRHVLVGDKLFITGGRDQTQEFCTVLTYDIKEYHLKRVGDMKVPHSYHTLEYNDVYRTVLVIGGQNNKHTELFDIFTNRWRLLPDLNVARANSFVYFDKDENNIYSLFGLKGDTTLTDYSDVIEILELQDMAKGWTNIEYKNKSEMDFKSTYCGAHPVTKDKLLIYGASKSRNISKSYAVFLMNKFEIVKVDNKMMEDIRGQARKSAKLSKILSTMSSA